MANKYLAPFYKKINKKAINARDFNIRLEIQSLVYLSQELGAPIGNYGFHLCQYGVYSQSLSDDIYCINHTNTDDIIFSTHVKYVIQILKNIIHEKPECYNTAQWLQCISSLLYIKQYVMSSACTKTDIMKKLTEKVTYLSNTDANNKAYDIINKKGEILCQNQ